MQRRLFAAFCAFLGVLTQTASADGNALPVLAQDIAAQFPAVGRIGQEGFVRQGCSATLIAPDLVLTAAHCLPETGIKGRVFAAGWSQGSYLAERRVKSETRHPAYAPDGTHSPKNDLGLVVLESPMTEVNPITLGDSSQTALDGAEVALVGFHADRPGSLSGKLTCPVITLAEGQLYVGCPVIHGNSGSPLLRQNAQGEWQAEAVVSSRIGPGAIAVPVLDWLKTEVAAHLTP